MKGGGSGWHNESRRHSLARRGIKTVPSRMMARGGRWAESYYAQLEPIVLDYLKAHETDFTKYDRALMDKFDEFVLAIRESGTGFIPIEFEEDATPEERLAKIAILDYNNRFFYAHDGIIEEVSKGEAEKILRKRIMETEGERKYPILHFPEAKLEDVEKYARYEIWERQGYGKRKVLVNPKHRYTRLFWSNGAERWIPREEVYHDNEAILDANEILLPFRLDQVKKIVNDLPVLPLFELSYESKERYASKSAMPHEVREDINLRWAYLQAMRDYQEKYGEELR